MTIREACDLLKEELLDNGYEYGFYINGITYKPDFSQGFDNAFFERLLKEYRVQNPKDTMQAKVGTCHDAVVLMKSILDEYSVPSKIWLGLYESLGFVTIDKYNDNDYADIFMRLEL